MKKFSKIFLSVLLITILALVLVACGDGASETPENGDYKDGTYIGKSQEREFGYEEAEVTIVDGEITDIVLKRMTPEGEEVDYDEWTGADDKPNLAQFRKDLAEAMLEKQSHDVDTIATATESTQGWKEAVKDALDQAR